MGWAERGIEPDGNSGAFAQLTPVVKWLLITNIALYLADILLFDYGIREFGAFTIQSGIFEGRIWKFVTFQFIHGSIPHILMNSIALFFFGPWMERWWGSKPFIVFYLLCGVGGALFYTLLISVGILPREISVVDPDTNQVFRYSANLIQLIGASAGIYGILVGVAVTAPSLRVSLLFPPITLTMRQLALAFIGIAVASIIFGIGGNEGGEAGHLGGAIVGFICMKAYPLLKKSEGFKSFSPQPKTPRRDIEPKLRPRSRVDLRGESEVDLILDKISKDGFQSLTDEERDVLKRAAERGNKKS
ncbi:MAG: rhomboid family intramembrane serine protease [Luteolibacter sp.]